MNPNIPIIIDLLSSIVVILGYIILCMIFIFVISIILLAFFYLFINIILYFYNKHKKIF